MDRDWQNWIDRLKAGDLSAEELREFENALREHPERADEYLDALLTETSLESVNLPDLGWMKGEEGETVPAKRAPERTLWKWGAAAAAVVAMGFAGYHFGRGKTPAGAALPQPVATITDADDAAADAGLKIGAPLAKGKVVVPENSKVGIAMRDGARLELRGPAILDLESASSVRLGNGRLSTYAPSYAHGFTVATSDGRVVDLGTRFVTATGTMLGTEIHVLEGLVETYAKKDADAKDIKKAEAAIMKNGELKPTDYLARRFDVPLDPVLPDSDGDGIPDVVELQYGSNPHDPASKPVLLRMQESFNGYPAGPVARIPSKAIGTQPDAVWQGGGTFVAEGLTYQKNGRVLETSGGSLRTSGEMNVGATLFPLTRLPDQGVFYISFLERLEIVPKDDKMTFAGLLLYKDDKEDMFTGDISVARKFGGRFKLGKDDVYNVPLDGESHLLVIRIDRTRLVTDVYVDPEPGSAEKPESRAMRYQDVPEFDRISMRSGSNAAAFPARFDEIRMGLTWESVLPVAK